MIISVDEIRRERFMSQGIIYFLGAAYIMEGTKDKITSITVPWGSIPWFNAPVFSTIIVASILGVMSIVLFYLGFNDSPARFAGHVEELTMNWRIVPFLVFATEWIKSVGTIVGKDVTPWFVVPYFYIGFLLTIAIPAQILFEIFHRRKQKLLEKSRDMLNM